MPHWIDQPLEVKHLILSTYIDNATANIVISPREERRLQLTQDMKNLALALPDLRPEVLRIIDQKIADCDQM